MKILFVLEYYYPNVGGVEKLFKTLAESLAMEGHETFVITNKYDKNLASNEILNKVKIIRLNYKNRFLFTFFSIFNIIKYAGQFDLIHTTSYNAALPAGIAGFIRKKKVIITFHEVWGKLWFHLPFINLMQGTFFFLFEKCILKLPFHRFIAVSESTKNDLINNGIKPEKIIKIYNGIEYPAFQILSNVVPKFRNEGRIKAKPDESKFTFTFLGRLGISKGLDILIPAAKKFIQTFPDAEFHMITPDTPAFMYKIINRLINQQHLEENIYWHNNLKQDQIRQQLLFSNCLVIPSYSEGFCFVAAEAASLGIPIVSSGRKALREVVSGKYIQIKNLDADGIFDALIEARNGKFEESKLIKFNFDDCLNDYLHLYKSILE